VLLSQRMGYTYLVDWVDRPANSDIEPDLLKAGLAAAGQGSCRSRAGPIYGPTDVWPAMRGGPHQLFSQSR